MPILALFENIFENFFENFYENSCDKSVVRSAGYSAGVSKRQRAGTLEKVVKYDKDAFDKAWALMASSPSDEEE